jgi:peptide/nickel transport system substrate-binding protein
LRNGFRARRASARSLVIGVGSIALVLASCGAEKEGARLVVGFQDAPLTLDPQFHNDAITWSVLSNFYDGLVRFSADMRIEAGLASSWEQITPRRWRFRLRRDLHFHDGSRVRATDVVATFDRARLDARSGIRHHLVGIRRVVAADEETVDIESDEPRPTLLNRLPFVFVVPAAAAAGAEITRPVGTGPYRVEQVASGKWIDATAVAGWRPLPEVHQVRFVFDHDQARLLELFTSGQVDVLRQVPDELVGELRSWPHVRAESQPRLAVQMLALASAGGNGPTASALADVRVRRAILLATNRDRWVREVFRGNGLVASQYVHPVVFGYDPALAVRPYDPDQARALLREAGYPGGISVPLDYAPMQAAVVPALVADLARVGVVVIPSERPWPDVLERARSGRSAMTLFAWACSSGDASDFLATCVHSPGAGSGLGEENYSGFRDSEVDGLIEAADREQGSERRLQILQEIQRRVLAALPVLPLTVRWATLGLSDRIEVPPRHDQWLWVASFSWRSRRP